MKDKFSDLNFKSKFSYITAAVCFVLGWTLTFINFFVEPVGEVSEGTLWILGQSLIFVGSVIGIAQYTNSEIKRQLKQMKDE